MPESKQHSTQELSEEMTYVFAELLGGAIGLRSQGMTGAAELIEESVAHLTDQRDGLIEQVQSDAAYRELNELLDQAIDREKGLEEQYEGMKARFDSYAPGTVEGQVRAAWDLADHLGQSPVDSVPSIVWLERYINELKEQLEAALLVVEAAHIAYDGFGEDDHRFYGSQIRLAAELGTYDARYPARES